MIPADILTVLLAIGLAIVLAWLVLRQAGRAVARQRCTCGGWGVFYPSIKGLPRGTEPGWHPTAVELYQASKRPTAIEQLRRSRPKAPETGSGLYVGDGWN